jgi:hypothetical protein
VTLRLIGTALLLFAAFSMASALITRDGVGFGEYITGIALVIVLLVYALRLSRRALQRG